MLPFSTYGSTKEQAAMYLQEKNIWNKSHSVFSDPRFFSRTSRKSLNIVGIIIALMLPWLVFTATFALTSFWMRFTRPVLAYSLLGIVFAGFVLAPMILMANGAKKKIADPQSYQPTWYIFLSICCLLAFIFGYLVGEHNYRGFMHPYYSLMHLAHYSNVDTNVAVGQQIMDAGRVTFKNTTALDLGHSMGFKNSDVFCVAPIITKASLDGRSITELPSVDFWAVGTNCCSGVQADFHCKGFADPNANGAIRLMGDQEAARALYRLAVQQAEATYKLTATHPLFFEWVHDAEESTWEFAQDGYIGFISAICTYFVVQIFFTIVAMLAFSKMVDGA
jgi:hypothetical protein|mmetsp:Transcript_99895/g.158072  ORF Transcript_99895/g.158072 Transcript_99895/m.158072 type:complete len:335 (-) Transcript_99895:125-1129(-)